MAKLILAASLVLMGITGTAASLPERSEAPALTRHDRLQDQMALALAYHEAGNRYEAEAALDAALRLDPAYAPALTLMKTYRRPGPEAK